ncbi:imelysin family protein [Rhodomicrobium vannielii]|uniref:imelysin family protein n=1 Tax=Rhodomicrobium vannielii TaxID=1069 RepID=UPI003D7C2E72
MSCAKFCRTLAAAAGLLLAAAPAVQAADPAAVVKTYADIAQAGYEDAVSTAKTLQAAITAFLAKPTPETQKAAREAWLAARVPYMQTEAFRFGNKIVDDWEGKVNSWPLDEGLIDYVDTAYGIESEENALYAANVIANDKLTLGGKDIDASKITKTLLADELHQAGGVEANVSIGYHAVEFLLWGQDLNGTGPGAGDRPATDFDVKNCTGGHCERRAEYLRVVTDLLVEDLEWMAAQWGPTGDARKAVTEDPAKGVVTIFTGLGSLSYGELAGERMKLGLLLHDPEEEHDCFADNTHNSHHLNIVGMRNVYLGSYKRVDGSTVAGASPADLVKAASAEGDQTLRAALDASLAAAAALKQRAESKERYDQMIGEGNAEGNAVVQTVIDKLLDQTKAVERAVAALKLEAITFEGSDSLDDPSKAMKGKKG